MADQPPSQSSSQSGVDRERRAYLVGKYDMLRTLTTSPRMNKPQLELLAGLADELRPELESLGVDFKVDS